MKTPTVLFWIHDGTVDALGTFRNGILAESYRRNILPLLKCVYPGSIVVIG